MPQANEPFKKEDLWIKPRKQLLEYQINFFKKEAKRVEQNWQKSMQPERIEHRRKSHGLKYDSKEEIQQAYLAGLLDTHEWRKQLAAYWHTYSDRGAEMKIAWLREQQAEYEKQYEALLQLIEEKKIAQRKRKKKRKKKYKKIPKMKGEEE